MMRKIFEKYLIVKYVVSSYFKYLLCSVVAFVAIFATLVFTGLYSRMETALDLKYNSPFVLVPLYGFLALAVLCFFIGFLLYFYKYKRSKTRSVFYKTFSNILNEKQMNKGG